MHNKLRPAWVDGQLAYFDGMGADLRIKVLGDLAIVKDGTVSVVTNSRQSRLLAALVLVPSGLTHDQLAERVWDDVDRPENPTPSVRTYVNRLRQQFGDDNGLLIVTRPGGYTLDMELASVDAREFEDLVGEEANLLDPRERADLLTRALDLWDVGAFGRLAELEWVMPEAVRLEELRLAATEGLLRARLDLGQPSEVVAEAEQLLSDHPYREGLREIQIVGLYRSNRQVDALRAFEDHRSRLVEDLGVDASPNLRRLEHLVLTQDPSLDMVGGMGRPLRGYRLRELIGSGSFSLVYRGNQPSVGRDVAIKVIRSELANRPRFISQFQAEAQTIARLEHPHIVPLYDYWREPDKAYLVMRLLPGNLADLIAEGDLDSVRIFDVIDQVASALDFAHRSGVIHRDVKPANILLDLEGNAFLSDFGIAVDELVAAEAETGITSSSGDYRAPEYASGERAATAVDVYALGLVAREALAAAEHLETEFEPLIRKATARDPNERHRSPRELAAELRAALEGRTVPRQIAEAHENPYRGLSPFEEADAAVFFGREELVEELATRLISEQERFLSIVGASGSGKSSVVLAGLVPKIRLEGDPWLVTFMRPGPDPFASLTRALEAVAVSTSVDLGAVLSGSDDGLDRVVDEVLQEGMRLLLIIDQFEELYTASTDVDLQERFLRLLTQAVTGPGLLHVVITLRADFYDRPLELPDFARVFTDSVVTVGSMGPSELESAITGPAEKVGVEVEPALLGTLVAEANSRIGALPLLQYTLTELYETRDGGGLFLDTYTSIGGLTGVLRARAEDFYRSLGRSRRDGLKNLLIRLVDVSDRTITRRRMLRATALQLDGVDEQLVERLAALRLISLDREPESREPVVEIAHEAVIAEWPRLAGWLDEHREMLLMSRRLTGALEEWEQSGRNDDFLLAGDRLAGLVPLKSSGVLTSDESNFLLLSERSENAREAKRRRRRTVIGATLGAAAVLVVALGALAVSRQRAAVIERDTRAQTELVNRSLYEAHQNLDLALLLAVEAYRRDPSPESAAALFGVLSRVTPGLEAIEESAHQGPAKPLQCKSSTPAPGVFASVADGAGPEGELVITDASSGHVDVRREVPFTCEVQVLPDGGFLGATRSEGIPFPPVLVSLDGGVTKFGPEIRRVLTQLSDGRLFGELMPDGGFSETGALVVLDPASGDVIEETGIDSLELIVDSNERHAVTQKLTELPNETGATIERGLLDLDTYDWTALPEDLDGLYFWAPAGSELLVLSGGDLLRIDLEGEVTAEITIPLHGEPLNGNRGDFDGEGFHYENAEPAFLPSFSPDGTTVAITTTEGVELFTYPEFSSVGTPIPMPQPISGVSLIDSSTLASQDASGVVYVMDIDVPAPLEAHVPFNESDGVLFLPSPEYGAIEFGDFGQGDEFRHIDLSNGQIFDEALQLGIPPEARRDAHPLTDGRWVVFLAGLEMAVLDSSGTELLRTPMWPDGARDETVHVGHDDWVRILYATEHNGGPPSVVQIRSVNVADPAVETSADIAVEGWVNPPLSNEAGFWTTLEDGRIEVFDWDGSRRGILEGDLGRASSLGPDGRLLAVVNSDRTVTVFDTSSGRIAAHLQAGSHYEPPLFVDGEGLVVRSAEGAVQLWDIPTERTIGTLASAPEWPPFETFPPGFDPLVSRDGQSIWFTQEGVFVRVLIDPDSWAEAACESAGRSLTQAEWVEFVPFDEPYRDACQL